MANEKSEVLHLVRLVIRKLAVREQSVGEIRQYLGRKVGRDGNSALVDEAVKKLMDLQLLDDEKFTTLFIQSKLHQGKGPAILRMELRQKGVSEDLITTGLGRISEEQWMEAAAHVLDKKQHKISLMEPRVGYFKAKKILYDRGFSTQIIKAVVDDTTRHRVE